MSPHRKKPLNAFAASSGTAGNLAQGLALLHKAVRGAEFYPQGHPCRTEALQRALEAFQRLLALRPLVFAVNRRGFMVNRERIEGGAMALQLAHDCVIRQITSITFLQDLLLYDLDALVRLLSSDPHKLDGTGPQLEGGGRSIWINERDVDTILSKRAAAGSGEENTKQAVPGAGGRAGSAGGAGSAGVREGRGRAVAAVQPAEPAPATAAGGDTAELLTLLAQESGDVRYQELGRQLLYRLGTLRDGAAMLTSLEELLRQHRESQRSLPQKTYAIFAFGQLADAAAPFLLGSLESKDFRDKERIHQVLAGWGEKAARLIIDRIAIAEGLYQRRSLAAALVALGPAAVEPLTAMLKDSRWYVVRNMVSVIGELGSGDRVAELRRPLYHADDRVRKETIRALAKIGGRAAEALLITILEEPEEVLVRRAISSLGQMRSRQAVPAMLKLLERRDLLLKELAVKKELLAALAAIGDCSATARLLKMLESRGWSAPGRWLELKVALASTLGALGDEAALPALARLAGGSGALAEACRGALAAVENNQEGNC